MKEFKMLMSYAKGNVLKYMFSMIAVIIGTFCSLLVPIIIRYSIDNVIGSEGSDGFEILDIFVKDSLLRAGIIILLLTLIRAIFVFYKGKWSAEASESIAKNLRDKLYKQIQNVKFSFFNNHETGDLIQRSTSDIETIRRFLAVQLVEVGNVVFMLVIISYLMLNLDFKMTIVALSLTPLIMMFSVFFFIKVKEYFKISDESEGELSTVLQENITGVRVVKAFGQQRQEIEKFKKVNDAYYEKTYSLIKMFAMYWSVSDILCYFQVVLVLFFGTIAAVNGEISLGTLVAFISYESLLLWPVRQFGRVLSDLGKALVAVERINEILVEELDENGEGIKPEVRGEIEFKNVSFAYEGTNNVLKDISFKIEKGMTLGIIGPTGSGKTSLIHLIARLYESSSGDILIDGVNIRDINKKWLRSNIDLVLQEPFLYTKTIKENIKISNKDYTMDDVIEAAKMSAVHLNIIEFDKGYKTLVGEKGVSLSGGQRQRVAIARNVINHNPILIFDDSLSAVDTETDRLIRKQLKDKMSDVSTIIISHRISSIMDCDKILVLENGEISGFDTHANLVETNKLYKNIWNIQNSAS